MAKITGMEKVLRNLAREAKRIDGATDAGVIGAAMFIRRQSQKLTPIRLGNLRNSAYVVASGLNDPPQAEGGPFRGESADQMEIDLKKAKLGAKSHAKKLSRSGPVAAVGYGAVYALSVHENPHAGAAGNTAQADAARSGKKDRLSTIHSKRGQWKFLEQPLKENQQKILEIIKRKARI